MGQQNQLKLNQQNQMAKKSTNPTASKSNPFGDTKGEKFGGNNNRLILNVGEVVHDFIHIKIDKGVKLTDKSDPMDLHVALDPRDGQELRMPASAVFRKNIDAAKLETGDIYSVARTEDAIKKSGKGKGNKMEVYMLLVTKRIKK